LADGRIVINTNTASPGLFFKDSAGTGIVKVGPVHVGTTAPNSTPAVGGSTGNYRGEQWLDTSVSPAQMKVWNGSAWVAIVADELPVSKLQDGAAGQIIQTDSAGTGVEWSNTTNLPLGTATAPAYSFQGDANTGIYSPGADQVAISTNGTGRLFVGSSGNIGVGTNTPSRNVQVLTSSNTFQALTSSTTLDAGLLLGDTDSDSRGQVRYANAVDALLLYTAGSERLRITSDGKLGLGTSAPDGKLTVGGPSSHGVPALDLSPYNANIATTSDIVLSSNGCISASSSISNVTTGTGFFAWYNNATADNTGTDGATHLMRLDGQGRLGVGTTSPDLRLTVQETATAAGISLLSSDGNPGGRIGTSGEATTTNGLVLNGNRGSGSIQLQIASLERARIDSSGRLLVGTSTSIAGTLGINGQIQLHGTSGAGATQSVNNWSSVGSDPARIFLGKSSSGSVGTRGIVTSGSHLGLLRFAGDDGANFIDAAQISAYVDGTPGANDMPGRLVFSVTADGASSPTEAMRIKNTRVINFSNAPVYADNAAAKTGGLVDGDVYRTSTGDLKIVYT